jgi:hypothetical protein
MQVTLRYVAGAQGWTSPLWSDAYGLTYQCYTYDPAIMNDPAACGDNARWSFADGVLSITGEGKLWDYFSMSAKPWDEHKSEIRKIVISEGITHIGSRAFSGIYNVTEVVFPESLTAIGECAFENCSRLGSVYLLKNLNMLGNYAFMYCHDLTNVYFEGDVPANWGMHPFAVNYEWVDNVQIPVIQVTLRYAKGSAAWTTPTWEDSYGITYACEPFDPDVLKDPTACGDNAHWSYADGTLSITGEGEMWDYTNLPRPWDEFLPQIYHVVVSEGITRIGGSAFASMNAQTVTLPSTLREIGLGAFRYSRFNQIDLPQGLTTIEREAFWNNNNLGKIMLPASLTYLGDSAFYACHNLTKAYFAGDVPAYWGREAFIMNTQFVNGERIPYTDTTLYYANGADGWTTPTWEDPYGFAYNTALYNPDVLNDPTAANKSWSLEVKIPWFSLRECAKDSCYPDHMIPNVGEVWRMTFSRVEWEVDIVDGKYVKRTDPATGECLPEHNWLWAPTGVIDAHMPEMWGYLVFTEAGEDHPLPAADEAKLVLRRLYYRQHAYGCAHGKFCPDAAALLGEEAVRWGVKTYATPSLFEGILEWNGRTFHIDQSGYLWEGELF